ncbi:DUF6286 domain-containing protein [Actinopolymorpha singaporensis]|uniref:DUF6286 domain-containing protein n=1 Tax=Actinopolymorpha singaporensis TaxID=117157 RepID=A0A1H1N8P3_9ACTN|nr:DUF6286 domain-containing protein [Actinopolymorpha singaporensis]SDR95230.1 hypothetical protein SAMN04489717_1138 [Actinopolymorpha singaporensis]
MSAPTEEIRTAEARPAPPPPGAGDRKSLRRATHVFRPRRVLPATIVAIVLAVVAGLVALEVIGGLFGSPPGLLPVERLSALGRETRWNDSLPFAVCGLAVLLGLLLVFLALKPGRPRAVVLASADPQVVMGIESAGMSRHLARAAESVPGVSSAQVAVSARRVRVVASSSLRDTVGLDEQVRTAVSERVDELAPMAGRPNVRVTVRRRQD